MGLAQLYETARTGIHRVISSLIPALLTLNEKIRITSLSSTEINLLTQEALAQLGLQKNFFPATGHLETTLFQLFKALGPLDVNKVGQRAVSRLFRQINTSTILKQCDIYHSTFLPLPAPVNHTIRFLSLYDLIPIMHPEYFLDGFSNKFQEIINSVDPERDWILTISQSSKKDICTHLAMHPERIFVAHPAASPDLYHPVGDDRKIQRVLNHYQIPEPGYFLSLATLEYRKNMATTLAAFKKLLLEPGYGECSLVLTGTYGWKVDHMLRKVKQDPLLRNRVHFTGFVADHDLSSLYSGAIAFVYPSLYEGFGLPVLEAMQCGIPVISSNTSSLPEVVGKCGLLVDPMDSDGLAQAMLTLVSDEQKRRELRRQGLQRARSFSWQRCAENTILAYSTAWEAH